MRIRTKCVGRAGSRAEVAQEAVYFSDRPVVIVEEIKRDASVLLASLNPHMPPCLSRTYALDQHTPPQSRNVHINSDIVFGLFMLLGYRFCPRLADLGDTRFYRIDSRANYGPLNDIARHWDDLLRVAGSLRLGVVSAHEPMRTFQGSGRNSSLVRALAEYGRIGKTLHLLDLADDELYRRSLLIQVNTGERRHGLARTVFQGHRGQLRQAYREGQEDQLGALGLVLNAIVVWNTRYMGLALDDLRSAGMRINPDDVERLSPLLHHHIHLYLDVSEVGDCPAEGAGDVRSAGSPRSASSSDKRRLMAVCRSTSRGHARAAASSINCCSRASRARSRGAYSVVVKNLEHRR
ncbi:MAG: Tn3 family transposase [Chloroflexi bacterium]|nr:Tn3 family transposase [Chloroflexota bacterium]